MRIALLVLCATLGAARAEPAKVDARVVGTWEMTVKNAGGAWTVVLDAQAAGRYHMQTLGPSKVPDDRGTLGASGGAWRMQKAEGGPVARGTYVFADADTFDLTIGGKTVTWHRSARVQSEADALYERAQALIEKNNYRDALPILTDAAKRGSSNAQHLLGFVLQEGQPGVPKDAAAAAGWYAKAAAQGNRASQYALGGMIEEGDGGLTKDPKRAAELYEASAKQGLAKAQFAFGLSCEFVLNDRKRAITYLELAGKQGEGNARWIAQFLRRPGTPHLKDEKALGAYMNAQVAAWMASSMPKSDTSISSYYNERWRMFYSQGDTARGDACKYNGRCY